MEKEGRSLPPGGFFYFNSDVLCHAVGMESLMEAAQILKVHPSQIDIKVTRDLSEEFEMEVAVSDQWLMQKRIPVEHRAAVQALREKEIRAAVQIVGERFEERMRRHLAAMGWPNNEGKRNDERSKDAGDAADLQGEG